MANFLRDLGIKALQIIWFHYSYLLYDSLGGDYMSFKTIFLAIFLFFSQIMGAYADTGNWGVG